MVAGLAGCRPSMARCPLVLSLIATRESGYAGCRSSCQGSEPNDLGKREVGSGKGLCPGVVRQPLTNIFLGSLAGLAIAGYWQGAASVMPVWAILRLRPPELQDQHKWRKDTVFLAGRRVQPSLLPAWKPQPRSSQEDTFVYYTGIYVIHCVVSLGTCRESTALIVSGTLHLPKGLVLNKQHLEISPKRAVDKALFRTLLSEEHL